MQHPCPLSCRHTLQHLTRCYTSTPTLTLPYPTSTLSYLLHTYSDRHMIYVLQVSISCPVSHRHTLPHFTRCYTSTPTSTLPLPTPTISYLPHTYSDRPMISSFKSASLVLYVVDMLFNILLAVSAAAMASVPSSQNRRDMLSYLLRTA